MQKGKILKSNKDKTKINISFWSLGLGKKGIGRKEKRRIGKKKKKKKRREEDQRYGKVWIFVH